MSIPFSPTPAIVSLVGLIATTLHAAPVIPGLEHKHPLTEVQQGKVLIEELRCASCHAGMPKANAAGPDLREVGARIQPEFLKKFIQDPALHDPGTTMPDVFGDRPAEDKEKIAAELSAYLLYLQSDAAKPAALPADKAADGKKLFHEVGCVACHSPQDDNPAAKNLTGHVNLAHVSKKYHPAGLADFLHEPLKVRSDGRMPDMGLSRSEAELLAAFMIGTEESETKKETPTPAMIAAGKNAFAEMSCNACHNVDSDPKPPILPAKAKPDLNAGCLSEKPGKAPDYQLSDAQKKAIRAVLTEHQEKPKPADSINMRLTQLNCISCHQRDDFGGVRPELDSYFHSTEEALGNESRIPPPLTLVGAKLRPEWLNKVLYESQTVRPYMTTRMPQYGNHALDGLQQLFAEIDKLEPFDYPEIKKESARMMREEGHRLLGDEGLSCISCHNFNGIESPSMKGLDLMTSYQRLQPAWFDQFMKNPAKFRPGIIMPSFWPDGKAVQSEILDGDTELQLQALWHQFSLGRSARDPSGLRAADPELIVTDQTRTYRGRSTVAGYRGIAVGFPGGMNYAFNAHNGALSAFWTGKFVTVGWRGQGSGNFTPAAPVIQLAEDVAFLTELPETWPLKPVRTKEAPVNPDPTYPSQHGYAFKGYSIGEKGVPTFRYHCGDVAIEDTSVAESKGGEVSRTLTFNSNKATTLYFRVLAGKIEAVSESSFKIPKLQLILGKSTAKLSNILRETATHQELILKLDLPAGTSTFSLDYAILP